MEDLAHIYYRNNDRCWTIDSYLDLEYNGGKICDISDDYRNELTGETTWKIAV